MIGTSQDAKGWIGNAAYTEVIGVEADRTKLKAESHAANGREWSIPARPRRLITSLARRQTRRTPYSRARSPSMIRIRAADGSAGKVPDVVQAGERHGQRVSRP